jgi:hypothetical protein
LEDEPKYELPIEDAGDTGVPGVLGVEYVGDEDRVASGSASILGWSCMMIVLRILWARVDGDYAGSVDKTRVKVW